MIEFTVNGTVVRTASAPDTPLVSILRDELRLTGTKVGCDDGRCGSCTVQVDGRAMRACRLTTSQVAGARIVTIEGLGEPARLHPLQQAFIEAGAVHCGFCTPGAIMSAKALLDTNPNPDRPTIIKALGANYCRCTGYRSMVDAVERAAGMMRGNHVTPPAVSLEDCWNEREMVTGRARYGADISLEGMLHVKVVRSPHPHARVVAVDATDARSLPGVVVVLTGADVPVNHHGRIVQDEVVLASDRVRMIGDPVAAVVAESEAVAAEAALRVRVRYDILPAVTSARAALEPGAVQVHAGGNVLAHQVIRSGDAEAALAGAVLTVESSFSTSFNEHACIEPEAAIARIDEDGRVVVHSPTSHPHLLRVEVARVLDLPQDRVRIVPTMMGGHFGRRTDVAAQCILAVAAWRLGRPVRCVYTREEAFISTPKRHAFEMNGRLGADANGRFTGLELKMIADGGAYASAGPFIIVRAAVSGCGPYAIPDVWLGGSSVYTNNTMAGAMRGFGAPQSTFALETMVDEMARRLRRHPIDLRLQNALRPGVRLATGGLAPDSVAFIDTLEVIRPRYDEAVRRAREATGRTGRDWIRRGVGVASMWYGIGTTTGEQPSHADVELLPSGRVAVLTGVTDAGQGSDFLLRRIAADTLGIQPKDVDLVRGDTDVTRDTGSCTGSRVCFYAGNAVRIAASSLRQAILAEAARELGVAPDALEWSGQRITQRGPGGRALALAELAARLDRRGIRLHEGGTYTPDTTFLDPATGIGRPYATYASATQMAEAEVDMRTGAVRVRRVVAAHDIGKVLNPAGARGQVEGAVVMGIGYALKEEFVPGVTRDFTQYRIPTTHDMPEVEAIFVERGERNGPFGAKGLGECAMIPTAPAILNAVADATGARLTRLPATPERVLAAIGRSGQPVHPV